MNIYFDFNAILAACLAAILADVKDIGGANVATCDAIPGVIKDVASSVIGGADPDKHRFTSDPRGRKDRLKLQWKNC